MAYRSIFLVGVIASVASSSAAGPAQPNRVVLAADQAPLMLRQCSRDAPPLGEGAWQPTDNDIEALERLLPKALSATRQSREVDFTGVLHRWQRQYIGVIRGGRRFVYGNFFPVEEVEPRNWRTMPVKVCDGGPPFFGVEFDVEAHRFTRIDFNGSI